MVTEKRRLSSRRYYLANKEKLLAQNKTYCLANKEKVSGCRKKYYQTNREKIKVQHKTYNQANAKKIKVKIHTYHQANKEKMKAQMKAYRQANPEKYRAITRKRQALKLGVGHEKYTDKQIFERDGHICQLCGNRINMKLKFPDPYSSSIDHIIPVSKGGADAPINIQASHLGCNILKHAGAGGQLRMFG